MTARMGRPTKPRHTPDEKRCSRCRNEKPFWEFHQDGRNPDGLRSECAACTSKAKTGNAEAKAKNAAYMRKYRAQKRQERAA